MDPRPALTLETSGGESDADELIKFRRRYLPSGLSLEDERRIWKWKILDHPFRDGNVPAALVARQNGEIVGLLGLMPDRFRIAGADYPAVGFVDFCVNPDCRGAGILLLGRAIRDYADRVLYTASANLENETTNRIYTALNFTSIAPFMMTASVNSLKPAPNRRPGMALNPSPPSRISGPPTRIRFSPTLDPSTLTWRYQRYPLAPSLFLSPADSSDGRPNPCVVLQVSELDHERCLMVMDYLEPEDAGLFSGEWLSWLIGSLESAATRLGCGHVAMSVLGDQPQSALISAGFEPVTGAANLGCWAKFPSRIDPPDVTGAAAYLNLGTGDRFLTNVYHPPITDRRPAVFTYRLKNSPDTLQSLAARKTLLIRTSPFDHWAFVLDRFLNLCGPGNVTVLSNIDMPESFGYLHPKFKVLKFPKGNLTESALPADVRRELAETDFDQVVFTTHTMSVKYPREIIDSFGNICEFVRRIWPRDSLPIWVADWSYELKRLDDHFFELENISHEKLGLEFLSTLIKNRLTPLLPYLESFQSLVARPNPAESLAERRFLILAPHPDDEVIGFGGTMMRSASEGKAVQTVYLSDGAYSSGPYSRTEMVAVRREESIRVAKEMGVAAPVFLDCPAVPTFVIKEDKQKELARIIHEFSPDAIGVPFAFDHHPDHRRANVLLARILKEDFPREVTVYSYETWSMVPANVLVDITDWMDRKRRAIALFQSQTASFDYVHCTTGTNSHRSWLVRGAGYFEAFFRLPKSGYVSLIEQLNELDRM